jgi:RHS repeat-associated protein
MPQLREKPRLGFSSKNLALHQGHEVCNSTTALGFRAALHLERVRSRYTGKERDAESGNDYFGARYYASSMGRFMSPDWSAKQEPVPYAKLDNPQSLNLYAYVLNNPLDKTDPDGHDFWDKVLNKIQGKGWVDTPRPQLQAKDASPNVPSSSLHTDMKGHTTTFKSTDIYGNTTTKTIETKNAIDHKKSEPGADSAYSTDNIKGVSNRHAGQDAYGPAGAFIDTGDSRGRAIHGGGTGLPDPMADQQGWKPTEGCTRGQNADVISLGQTITNSQHNPAESGIIPYTRNDNPQ